MPMDSNHNVRKPDPMRRGGAYDNLRKQLQNDEKRQKFAANLLWIIPALAIAALILGLLVGHG